MDGEEELPRSTSGGDGAGAGEKGGEKKGVDGERADSGKGV